MSHILYVFIIMIWILKFSIYISNILIARDSHTSDNVKIVMLANPENSLVFYSQSRHHAIGEGNTNLAVGSPICGYQPCGKRDYF